MTSAFADPRFSVENDHPVPLDSDPPAGERWAGYADLPHASRGPQPAPDWLVTSGNAVDEELGLLKTGKEADVFLIRRWDPARPDVMANLLAVKRYRDADHRQFHRNAEYVEGRRTRKSRENRALARRTTFGRALMADMWANAEFAALSQLWADGVAVPYPVSQMGTELVMEFIGEPDGTAAPRLAQCRPSDAEATDLWEQFRVLVLALAARGYAHGDLSPYNLLVHDERLVMIDLPQLVDIAANPRGMEFLARDCRITARWFERAGLEADGEDLYGEAVGLAVGVW